MAAPAGRMARHKAPQHGPALAPHLASPCRAAPALPRGRGRGGGPQLPSTGPAESKILRPGHVAPQSHSFLAVCPCLCPAVPAALTQLQAAPPPGRPPPPFGDPPGGDNVTMKSPGPARGATSRQLPSTQEGGSLDGLRGCRWVTLPLRDPGTAAGMGAMLMAASAPRCSGEQDPAPSPLPKRGAAGLRE